MRIRWSAHCSRSSFPRETHDWYYNPHLTELAVTKPFWITDPCCNPHRYGDSTQGRRICL
jgi:hypothetical protein